MADVDSWMDFGAFTRVYMRSEHREFVDLDITFNDFNEIMLKFGAYSDESK